MVSHYLSSLGAPSEASLHQILLEHVLTHALERMQRWAEKNSWKEHGLRRATCLTLSPSSPHTELLVVLQWRLTLLPNRFYCSSESMFFLILLKQKQETFLIVLPICVQDVCFSVSQHTGRIVRFVLYFPVFLHPVVHPQPVSEDVLVLVGILSALWRYCV